MRPLILLYLLSLTSVFGANLFEDSTQQPTALTSHTSFMPTQEPYFNTFPLDCLTHINTFLCPQDVYKMRQLNNSFNATFLYKIESAYIRFIINQTYITGNADFFTILHKHKYNEIEEELIHFISTSKSPVSLTSSHPLFVPIRHLILNVKIPCPFTPVQDEFHTLQSAYKNLYDEGDIVTLHYLAHHLLCGKPYIGNLKQRIKNNVSEISSQYQTLKHVGSQISRRQHADYFPYITTTITQLKKYKRVCNAYCETYPETTLIIYTATNTIDFTAQHASIACYKFSFVGPQVTHIAKQFLSASSNVAYVQPLEIDLFGLTKLKTIDAGFLMNRHGLKKLNLKAQTRLSNIKHSFLRECVNLEQIIFPDATPYNHLVKLNDNFLNHCAHFNSIHTLFQTQQHIQYIGNNFFNANNTQAMLKLEHENISMIGDRFCYKMSHVVEADLSQMKNLSVIGDEFFSGCSQLVCLNLSGLNKIKKVGTQFLDKNNRLQEVIISSDMLNGPVYKALKKLQRAGIEFTITTILLKAI